MAEPRVAAEDEQAGHAGRNEANRGQPTDQGTYPKSAAADAQATGEGRYIEGNAESGAEKRAAIFIGPEFGTVSRPDLVSAAKEAGEASFDVLKLLLTVFLRNRTWFCLPDVASIFCNGAVAREFSRAGYVQDGFACPRTRICI